MVYKAITVAVLLVGLSGCEHTHTWAQRFSFLQPPLSSAEQFDFNWQLSGAREVAPLQLFSTPQQIWLQFAPEQNLPAIFALEAGRHRVVQYQRSEPYVIIKGNWQQLIFKGAHLEAQARYVAPAVSSQLIQADPAVASIAVPELTQELEVAHATEPITARQLYPDPDLNPHPNPNPNPDPDLHPLPEPSTVAFSLASMPFRAEPSDRTLRQTLKRWAQREGWEFQDHHWELEIDLPVVSAATFNAPFNQAVEQLMRSTALGSRPLQACFYSNKVMRVIALAQSCDPSDPITMASQG
ncbi:TcpQ domain-containing protein [Paenalcaligenes hominis]|uniref:TcpQ domain-containing protein n=1 Tax=Paenalcaligenes hominis TaxID=643674 RepID=UPI003525F440